MKAITCLVATVLFMTVVVNPSYAPPLNPWHVHDGLTVFVLDVTIPGYQDTEIDVLPDNVYMIVVRGVASTCWELGNPDSYCFSLWVGPGGHAGPPVPDEPGYLLPGAPFQCVIGKLGDGDPFYVGPGGHIIGDPDNNGRLYLALNDLETHFWDNFGYYVVDIIKIKPAPTVGVNDPGGPELGSLRARSFPSPMTSSTAIEFIVPQQGRLTVELFDAQGRLVRNLLDTPSVAGPRTVHWDGRSEHGDAVAAGTYLYRVSLDGKEFSGKTVVVR